MTAPADPGPPKNPVAWRDPVHIAIVALISLVAIGGAPLRTWR